MSTFSKNILFSLFAVALLTGCGKKQLKSPRQLARTGLDYTVKEQVNGLAIKAIRLIPEEKAEILYNAYEYEEDSMFNSDYEVIYLETYNPSEYSYTAHISHPDLLARSEIMPTFQSKFSMSRLLLLGAWHAYQVESSNGLTKDDAATLESFGVFRDKNSNVIRTSPFGSDSRIILLPKSRNMHSIRISVARSDGPRTFENITIEV